MIKSMNEESKTIKMTMFFFNKKKKLVFFNDLSIEQQQNSSYEKQRKKMNNEWLNDASRIGQWSLTVLMCVCNEYTMNNIYK